VSPGREGGGPAAVYRSRLAAREAARTTAARRGVQLGFARLAVVVAGGISLWLAWRAGTGWPWGLLIPLAVLFAGLVVVHDHVVRRREAAERAADFYREGLRRVEGRPSPNPGTRFLDPDHAYAGDLDLFGEGSLFERIDTARTRHGQDALAAWLTSASPRPPSAGVVRRRQEAVRELVDRLDLREALNEAGREAAGENVDHRRLVAWAVEPAVILRHLPLRVLAFGVPAVMLALSVGTFLGLPSWTPWAWVGVTLLAYAGTQPRSHRVTSRIKTPGKVLAGYERLVRAAEGEPFQAALLDEVRRRLGAGEACCASRELRRLRRIVVWTDALRNQIVAFVGLFLLWELHCALALERWRQRAGPHLVDWLDALGDLEGAVSLSAYAHEHPDHVFPEILDDGPPRLLATALGHPLIPDGERVCNDLALEGPGVLFLVSGSNMSGKSTMLRAVGVAAALAQAGSVVCAASLRIGPVAVCTSMRVIDSLQQGTSHFLAELHRLRRVTEVADSGVPLLYLLDEVLHGTNSRERLLGVRALVGHLLAADASGMITTHDLDLADLERAHPGRVRNVHFADRIEAGRMRFDYRMHPGVASTTNALRLMRSVGIPLDGLEETEPEGS
jgi:hypothetical protein